MGILKGILLFGVFLFLLAELTAQDYILRKLELEVSSESFDEIAPCVTSDGSTLYFTRLGHPDFVRTLMENEEDRSITMEPAAYLDHLKAIYQQLNDGPVADPVASAFNQDIWVAKYSGGIVNEVSHPPYPLNNALPNSVAALTPEDIPVVLNQFSPGGGMRKGFSMVEQAPDGSWQFPQPVGIDGYHNSGADVNLSISSNGNIMILSMEREDGYGASDLYISRQNVDGSWSYPENLGRGINSPYRESTPHLSKDMRSLYFSSDRSYPGRGGDIYVQERIGEDWKQWSSPRKFRSPINSDAEDSHPYFNEATGQLYFTSNRDGTFDIFSIQIKSPEPVEILTRTKPSTSIVRAANSSEEPKIGEQLKCENIFFLQSEASIISTSFPELNRIASLLQKHPQVGIRIAGHTDNVGEPALLMQLSVDRATAIKNYLVKTGDISAERIATIGFGASRPLNDNSTEVLRAKNRRVEIEVIHYAPSSAARSIEPREK